MRFVDECEIEVVAGDGGDGCIAFRREKYIPFGGPSGGDGGRGGDVFVVADPGLGTLYDLYYVNVVKADNGTHGKGKDCYGHAGKDREVRLPLGTVIVDSETKEVVGELKQPGERLLVAQGGKGGRGNIHFSTPVNRAPRRAEPGEPGQHRKLHLELKSMADVGLLGFPNVGKSTLISSVSRAHPKVADYPFTTLEPHLGVVSLGNAGSGDGRTFVIADIPGLVPGASQGYGLGLRFLRHVERTKLLLHLVTVTDEPDRDPVADYQALRNELSTYDEQLALRPEIVALTKSDLPFVSEAYPELKRRFAELDVDLRMVSAVSHDGLDALMNRVGATLHQG
ncbi:MAG TPA: GTPase ObgE [Polyangiaceae bacterium]